MKVSPKLLKLLLEHLQLSEEQGNNICSKLCQSMKQACIQPPAHRDSIYSFMRNVVMEMYRLNCRERKVNQYQLWSFAPILFWFTVKNQDNYEPTLLAELESVVTMAYRADKFSYASLMFFYHGLNLVRIHDVYGKLQPDDIPRRVEHSLGKPFSDLLDRYRVEYGKSHTASIKSFYSRISDVRMFLYFLERHKISSPEQLSHSVINEGITAFATNYDGGLKSVLATVRMFLLFLFEAKVTENDYSTAVPQGIPKRHKIRYGFTNGEVTAILGKINRCTAGGRRDYAMLLIAAKMGLRACDIANLRYQDINWYTNEVTIIQQKTKVALGLALPPEVGNAIAEYILYSRPNAPKTQVFRNHHKPYNPVKPETVGSAVTKYMTMAGVDNPDAPYRRTHAFRREYALNLLDSGISNDMLTEMLGQVNPNSPKPYLPLDETRLKHCGLSLASVGMAVEV